LGSDSNTIVCFFSLLLGGIGYLPSALSAVAIHDPIIETSPLMLVFNDV
jgi:hypothetical protein